MNKTRNLFFKLLCLAVLLSLTCGLSACISSTTSDECEHVWGEWETVTPASCTVDGSEKRVCTLNSEHTEVRTITKTGHSFTSYVSNGDATCTADGTKTAACENKDCTVTDTVTDAGSKLNHTFNQEVVDAKHLKTAQTCTAAAVYYKSCTCGENGTETFTSGEALNHANETMTSETPAGCLTDGVKNFTCPDCGTTRQETVSATNHNWSDIETVTANCEHGGYTIRKCSKCQTTERYNETGIAPCTETSAVTTPASCTEEGVMTWTCSVCGGTRTTVIPMADHDTDDVVTPPTCTASGYTTHSCKNCSYSYTDSETPSLGGHNYEISAEDSYDATCTEDGLTVELCKNEGCSGSNRETVVPATGHDWEDPTCTENGYCKTCDAPGEAKLNHSFTDVEEDVAPTCTEDGYITYGCSRCDATKIETPESYKATGHNEAAITWSQSEIAVEGKSCYYVNRSSGVCPDCQTPVTHDSAEYARHTHVCAITTAATCSADGVKTYTCSCGDSYTEAYQAADAHKWNEGVLQSDGVTTLYTCQYDNAHTKTTVSAKTETNATISSDTLNHSDEVELKDATLILDEKTKEQVGSSDVSLSAGKLEDDDDLTAALEQLSPTDRERLGDGDIYNFSMEIGGTLTSEFDGMITVRIPYTLAEGEDPEDIVICYINGDTPVLMEATYVEIDGVGYAVFETNHFSYYTVTKMTARERCLIYGCNEYVTVVSPSCLAGGYTVTVCLRCGEKTISNRIDALGHDFVLDQTTYVESTCVIDGYEKYSCSRCGIHYEIVLTAPGHRMELNTDQSTEPTCFSTGKLVYDCTNCSYSYTNILGKTAHDYESTVTAPGCTTAGFTTNVCKTCGQQTITNYVDPTGHDIADEIHAPTCIQNGYTAHYCRVCGNMFANTNVTEKTDHEWDRETPDCENDKKCKHCQELAPNGKAHGHSMKNGICEYCGEGCDHNFAFSHTVAPTCTAEGYDVYLCAICLQTENRNYVDTADHNYVLFNTTQATCQQDGIQTDICSVCGDKRETKVADKTKHQYTNGACVHCGAAEPTTPVEPDTDYFYLNMIESIGSFNGFLLKVENFSLNISELLGNADGENEWESYSSATADIAELMFYIDENGDIQGAAYGACTVVVEGDTYVYDLKAVVENGYLYTKITGNVNNDEQNVLARITIDEAINALKSELDLEDEMISVLTEQLLPAINTLVDANADVLDATLKGLINLLFEMTATENGYTFTLSFENLYALNDNLATKTIGELVDLYFGEGYFDDLAGFVTTVANTKISEIPALVESLGLDEETFISVANAVCRILMGAPEEFDIADVFADPDMGNMTLGMAITGSEEYATQLADMIEMIKAIIPYGEDGEDIVSMIDEFIARFEPMITLSFTTDANGAITGLAINLNEFVYEEIRKNESNSGSGNSGSISDSIAPTPMPDDSPNYDVEYPAVGEDQEIIVMPMPTAYEVATTSVSGNRLDLSVEITLSKDGQIEVTWSDIVDEIEAAIALPEKEDGFQESYNGYYYTGGEIEYNDKWYQAEGIELYWVRYNNYYSKAWAVAVMPDCGDWNALSVSYPRERVEARYTLFNIPAEDLDVDGFDDTESMMLLKVHATDEVILLTPAENGISYVRADGTTGTVSLADVDMRGEMEMYEYIFVSILGEHAWEVQYSSISGYNVYYNPTTKEFRENSPHNYEFDEEQSYEPEGCEGKGAKVYVCTICGDVSTYTYSIGHTHATRYQLSAGATSCEEGIDYIEYCSVCNEILYINENWGRGHQYTNTYTYEGGYVYKTNACGVCGAGSNSIKYVAIDTEETLELVTLPGEYQYRYDGSVMKFVPTESGVYEFYSSGRSADPRAWLLNASYEQILYNDDDLDYMNFGIQYEFVAGETYYLVFGTYSYSSDGNVVFTMHFAPQTVTEIDLAQYGCTCGGKLIMTSHFGEQECTVEANCAFDTNFNGVPACSKCGFAYMITEDHTSDENCNELYVKVAYFANTSTGTTSEYVISSVRTGESAHDYKWKHDYQELTETDENGVVWNVYQNVETATCTKCNNVVRKSVNEDLINDSATQSQYRSEEYEWSAEANELVIRNSKSSRGEKVLTADGNSYWRETYGESASYDNMGECTWWERTTSVYNGCVVTLIEENSDGYYNEHTSTSHSTSQKELPEESGSYEDVNKETGEPVTVTTRTFESYCTVCGASIQKTVTVTTTDANGNVLVSDTYYYESYANSDVDFGWRLRNQYVYTYGVYEYAEGKYLTYPLTQETHSYNESSGTYSDNKQVYSYPYENDFCQFSITYFYNGIEQNKDNNIRTSHRKMESTYRLHEGATSCEQGVDYWRVCVGCGYEELIGENWTKRHDTYYGERTEIDLANYGATCGGTVTLRNCVCGQSKSIDNNSGCDLAYNISWDWNGEGTRYEYNISTFHCAVTDPACGFSYTYENWYEVDENCQKLVYYRYTFGTNTDTPYVIEWTESRGYYHNTTSVLVSETPVTDDKGMTVSNEIVYDYVCQVCGHVGSTTTDTDYYDESGNRISECYENMEYQEDGDRVPRYYYKSSCRWILSTDGKQTKWVMELEYRENYNEFGESTNWSKISYVYDACLYLPTQIYEYSDGNREEYSRTEHYSWDCNFVGYVIAPTCTQPGVEQRVCSWCTNSYEYDVSPIGHDYSYNRVDGTYTCDRCHLTNFTGYDGQVWMEDLTATLGNGENFVIGYYFHEGWKSFEYIISVSLVVEGQDEPIILSVLGTDDGTSLIYVNISEVSAAAEALGYSLSSEQVRITIVPIDYYDEFDYAITLDTLLSAEAPHPNTNGAPAYHA